MQETGKLKIFFGCAECVGKTYEMLKEAAHMAEKGTDIVAGYIAPDPGPEALEFLNGLEVIPPKKMMYQGLYLEEFDLDGAIERKPEVILIDNLAHKNAPGCRNSQRYQDVEELLNLGIDVYTTVNVGQIESLHDVVKSVTGQNVYDRIPDPVFNRADIIKFVDAPFEEVIDRLRQKRVTEKLSKDNLPDEAKLSILRGIALRRYYDHAGIVEGGEGKNKEDKPKTEEHILVYLSPDHSNEKNIRTAARMVYSFKASFTALYVENHEFAIMNEDNKRILKEELHLASRFGARSEIVYGENVPKQIAEFAKLSGVTKVVIGSSEAVKKNSFAEKTMVEELIKNAPFLDLYIIPDEEEEKPSRQRSGFCKKHILKDILYTAGILALASLIGFFFFKMGLKDANIIVVYVLGVLVISVITKMRIFSLASSLFSVLIFNFLFTDPYYSLKAYDSGYTVTFFIMFLSGLLTSSLAVKLKNHARQSSLAAYRTNILLDTSQALQQARGREEIMQMTALQIIKLMKKDVIVYLLEDGDLGEPKTYYVNEKERDHCYNSEHEKEAALWCMNNNKHAGATTQTFSDAKCLYLAVRVDKKVYGVIGIALGKDVPDVYEKSILLSIIGECALALENEKNAREKEEAAVLAKNEQLRANLLRAISHDLRTPLTSISGNASNFLYNGDSMDDEMKKQLFMDVYDDSMWLINLVENLLAVTRLEGDHLNLHITSELVADVIDEALNHISRKKVEHHISVEYEDELLLARMDAKLIVQVIINIVDNAIKYTQAGSNIKISVKEEDKQAVISIADDGEGIPDEMKNKIFDMFYSGANKVADSRRSLGLGLALCKSIIQAHEGKIFVKDNHPQGTIFVFTLPIGEVQIHE